MKQIILMAVLSVSLMVGVLFWVTAVDLVGKIIGGVLMGIGIALVISFSITRDKIAADRRLLRANSRRIDARIDAVIDDGGSPDGLASYFYLQLKDPNDDISVYTSDPLTGSSNVVRSLLEYAREHGLDNETTLPVYIDPADKTHYFVDVSNDLEQVLRTKLGQ